MFPNRIIKVTDNPDKSQTISILQVALKVSPQCKIQIIMNKTQTLIRRILEVDNFQNVACVCENWEEFCFELEEWGVTSAAKIEFDDAELDVAQLDAFIKAENGYIREEV